MNKFYMKISPIIVILNFIDSYIVFSILVSVYDLGIAFSEIATLICAFLFIIIMNSIIIFKEKKKHSEDFSISGYIIFVLAIPCIMPTLIALIVFAINNLMHSMGLYYTIV